MNRRRFFSMFTGVVAAIPIVGKLVSRPAVSHARDAARDIQFKILDFRAENYSGPWKWNESPMTVIEHRYGKRLRIMHRWRTVRHYDHTTGVITDGFELI